MIRWTAKRSVWRWTLLSAARESKSKGRGQECPRHTQVGSRNCARSGSGLGIDIDIESMRLRLSPGRKCGRTAAEYPQHCDSRLREPQPDVSNRATLDRRRRARIQRPHPVPCDPRANGDADAVLKATVLSASANPLVYDSTSGRAVSALVTVSVQVTLTDRQGKVIFENPSYLFHDQYEISSNLPSFFQEDSPAVDRLSRDFARTLVANILEAY